VKGLGQERRSIATIRDHSCQSSSPRSRCCQVSPTQETIELMTAFVHPTKAGSTSSLSSRVVSAKRLIHSKGHWCYRYETCQALVTCKEQLTAQATSYKWWGISITLSPNARSLQGARPLMARSRLKFPIWRDYTSSNCREWTQYSPRDVSWSHGIFYVALVAIVPYDHHRHQWSIFFCLHFLRESCNRAIRRF